MNSLLAIPKGNDWIVSVNERCFSVNKIGLSIIREILDQQSDTYIQKKISSSYNTKIDICDITYIRKQLETSNKKSNPIKCKFTILKFSDNPRSLKLPSLLFNKYIVITILSALTILITTNIHLFNININNAFQTIRTSPLILFQYTIGSICILFLHELGHASASYRYNIPPKKIGFGIYFLFPILYTDVTKSWLATQKQRICIDTGGFYFQAIFTTCLLVIGSIFTLPPVLISMLLWDNLLIVIYNLNPLLKFDGYWIISDILGVDNLMKKSEETTIYTLKHVFHKRKIQFNHKITTSLYFIISQLYVVFTWYLFTKTWIVKINIISHVYHSPEAYSKIDIVYNIATSIILSYIVYISTKSILTRVIRYNSIYKGIVLDENKHNRKNPN